MKVRWLSVISGLSAILLGSLLSPAPSQAANYRISKIWQSLGIEPKINDPGQVVWDYDDGVQRLVYLYAGGRVQALSSDSPTMLPVINNNGAVAWQKNYSDQNNAIYLYSGNQIWLLSDQNNPQIPKINNRNQVLWAADGNGVLRTRLSSIVTPTRRPLPSPAGTTLISATNSTTRPRRSGREIFNVDLGINAICLYRNELVTEISPRGHFDQTLKINNRTQVLYRGTQENVKNLYLYDPGTGETTLISSTVDVYNSYDLNDQGQVVFCVDEGVVYAEYLSVCQGKTTKISHAPPIFLITTRRK